MSPDRRHQGLPFHNVGSGPALNVRVHVYWASGDCPLAPTSLAPDERAELPAQAGIPLNAPLWGRALYSDMLGRRWETRFTLEVVGGQVQLNLCAYGLMDLLPEAAYPAGWERKDGQPVMRLPEPRN